MCLTMIELVYIKWHIFLPSFSEQNWDLINCIIFTCFWPISHHCHKICDAYFNFLKDYQNLFLKLKKLYKVTTQILARVIANTIYLKEKNPLQFFSIRTWPPISELIYIKLGQWYTIVLPSWCQNLPQILIVKMTNCSLISSSERNYIFK